MDINNNSIPNFISCFLKDSDPLIQDFLNLFHVLFGRYRSHVQAFPEFLNRISRISWRPFFTTNLKIFESRNFELFKTISLKTVWNPPWIIWSALVSPKLNKYWFWESCTSENPQIMKMRGFRSRP